MRLVIPKHRYDPPDSRIPIFFLGGPIRGGGDWQKSAAKGLNKRSDGCVVVNPCRYKSNHSLLKYAVGEFAEHIFPRQLDWERYYLLIAGISAKCGCIVFWLPCESKTHPHPGPEPYAMDTRGELGEWRGRMMYDQNIRLVIGAEPEFLGLSQIKRNFDQALQTDFPIYNSLDETLDAAMEMANKITAA